MNKKEKIMEAFYQNFSKKSKLPKKISLEQLVDLKKQGITTENFLDFLCQNHKVLLHGSILKIKGNKLKSNQKKIFASNKASIAILKSIYSNIGVNLSYPYFFDKNPLVLKIYIPLGNDLIYKEKGFVYIVKNKDFQNEPTNSWQFINKSSEFIFDLVIETEKSDFLYPIEIYHNK